MIYYDENPGIEVIAQADSGGYDPSGYVCYKFNDDYYISNFSHCSCYGTWDVISPGDGDKYTEAALINMAQKQLDPSWKEREIMKEDYDYQYLVDVYGQILDHFNART